MRLIQTPNGWAVVILWRSRGVDVTLFESADRSACEDYIATTTLVRS